MKEQPYLAAKDAFELHLGGVPMLVARIKIELFNRTQLSILHRLAQLGREPEIGYLIDLDPMDWRKQGQFDKVFNQHRLAKGSTLDLLDEFFVYDKLKRCSKDPDIKVQVLIHEQLYYKKFNKCLMGYHKDRKEIRVVKLRKRRAQLKALKEKQKKERTSIEIKEAQK